MSFGEAHRLHAAARRWRIYGITCYENFTRMHEGSRALANWLQLDGLTTELIAKFAILLMKISALRTTVGGTTSKKDPRARSTWPDRALALERTS